MTHATLPAGEIAAALERHAGLLVRPSVVSAEGSSLVLKLTVEAEDQLDVPSALQAADLLHDLERVIGRCQIRALAKLLDMDTVELERLLKGAER